MPNKGMFPKDRPGGVEFPSCDACNQGSKWFEDIVSFLGSIRWDDQSDDALDHFSGKFVHLIKTHPEVIEELRPDNTASRKARRYASDASAINLEGEIVSAALSLYGAKLGLALHWQVTGQILPSNAQIGVYCMSNERRFEGIVPQHLFKLLPNRQELRKGQYKSTQPFFFASGKASETDATAHWVTFGDAMTYYLFAGETLDMTAIPANQRLKPGCLQTPKPKPYLQAIDWPIGTLTV